MNEEIIVFLGPTLSKSEAEKIMPARYFPPAKQGDLLSVTVQFKPKVIALIDGLFSQTLSVWHKEILFALSQGITVIGSSSMGALRAAEMESYGMIGIGKIFESYKNGHVIHDDEVALVHGPSEEGYIPLSVPLINIRFTLENLVTQNKMDGKKAEEILLKLQSTYFPDRSFASLDPLLQENYVDQKKVDAIQLLETLKIAHNPRKPFASTLLFDALYHYDRRLFLEGVDLPLRQIAHHAALHHPHFAELQQTALLETLLEPHVEVTQDEIQKITQEFLTRHSIAHFEIWLQSNDMSLDEFQSLMERKAKIRKLVNVHFDSSSVPWKRVKSFLDELKWNNTYEEWKENARAHEVLFKEAAPHFNEVEHDDLSSHLDPAWARSQGFENRFQLALELMKSQIVKDYLASFLMNL